MANPISSIPDAELSFVKEKLSQVREEIQKEITGLQTPVDSLMVALLSRGHVLIEGMPGLAKTLLAKTLARVMDSPFQRIQFTPDLLPADLTGTSIFNPKTTGFEIRKGPVFTGILLADEINRAPAKVQSALLQCMEERTVSIADQTFHLDPYFFVIATQNPIDQEGTYQLPEAQMDRFLFKIQIGYPSQDEELGILEQHGSTQVPGLNSDLGATQGVAKIQPVLSGQDRQKLHSIAQSVFIDPKLRDYIVRLVRATRPETSSVKETLSFIRHGASPRASLAFLKVAKTRALFDGRDFVIPEDIHAFAGDILRHRILLRFEALAEEVAVNHLIETILEAVGVP